MIKDIWDCLKKGWDDKDVHNQIQYLTEISHYYAYLSHLRNERAYSLRKMHLEFHSSEASEGLKQFEYKAAAEGFANDEIKNLEEVDMLLKAISKQMEALITIISFTKTELSLAVKS